MTSKAVVQKTEPGAQPLVVGGLLVSSEIVPMLKLEWCEHVPPMAVANGLPASRQPCAGSEQPLVDVRDIDVLDAYEVLGILPARRMMVRSDVAKRLLLAERLLPTGFGLVVLDAWRSSVEQQALVSHYGDGFVAPVSDNGCRPPHPLRRRRAHPHPHPRPHRRHLAQPHQPPPTRTLTHRLRPLTPWN